MTDEERNKVRRLTKSSDRPLCGVCGGLAEYLEVDPVLVRAGWVIGVLVGMPFFIVGYIVLAIAMPEGP